MSFNRSSAILEAKFISASLRRIINSSPPYLAKISSERICETSSNDKDDTEDFVSSSSNTQDKKGAKKLHRPVKCKYCPKKFKRGLATRMQSHTNNCLNAPESAKTIKRLKLQDSDLTQQTIYTSGIPLSTFKNPFWVEFFYALRPLFKIPNRDKLSTELLENVYEDIKNDWIATQIITKMEEVGIHKFSSVITDMAANMKAAWKIIEEKYPHIICLGCSSHVINLLIGDILKIDEIKIVLEDVKTVVKYFKDHHVSMAKLRRIQKENYGKEITLVLPVITRWGTHLDCIKTLIESQTAIQQMIYDQSTTSLETRIKVQLHSNEFWNNLKIIIRILKPIVAALKAFKANNSTISTTYS
ncbi:20273_t:CDS:2 [Gigaspora rosea]|nr:20273_t:CDS:2 [Gigaspora rosea]